MFTQLVESRRKRDRRARGAVASAVVHAVVIGMVCYATASAKSAPPQPETVVRVPIYHAPSTPSRRSSPNRSSHGGGRPIDGPALPSFPKVPPVGIPPVSLSSPAALDGVLATGHDFESRDGQASDGTPGDGIAGTVDEMARPLADNPAPVYPSSLRSSGVEGSVSARFVIDTAGRVEPASIAWSSGTSAVFEPSVRRALLAARYAPARVNGRPVRVMVVQRFEFSLREGQ